MLDIHWNIDDMGGLLAELGFPGVIEAARCTAQAKVSFTGAPGAPRWIRSKATWRLTLPRILCRSQHGPGRRRALASVLSVASARLTLDFSDLVQKGFSFDRFTGTAVVKNGVSRRKTPRSWARRRPCLSRARSTSPPAAKQPRRRSSRHQRGQREHRACLRQPRRRLGTFLAQLLLRNPLSRIFKVEYDITGSMDNPVISKVNDNEDKDAATRRRIDCPRLPLIPDGQIRKNAPTR